MSSVSFPQELKSVHIDKLKGIKNFDIDLTGSRLTAIMGVNGSGKSTILHALACCYKPLDSFERFNYKFSYFFTPTKDSDWKGSSFKICHDYRDGKNEYKDVKVLYSKDKGRWAPKYDRRPSRHVVFIGIETCVPIIEKEKRESFIPYTTIAWEDDDSRIIKEKAGIIMNRNYTVLSKNKRVKSSSEYIGVEYKNTRYTALSMGAGEQRIFKIVTEVVKAPKYSLILIDELDLLLHDDALKRMLQFLRETAETKKLQVVFTTHSQMIIDSSSDINIRHIYQTDDLTLCFNETKPDAIYRLTGYNPKLLEIFVEDDFAGTIVENLCHSIGMKRHVAIKYYGAASNCFTLASGIILSGQSISNSLFVLDGDEYKDNDQKRNQVKKVLTGDTERMYRLRENVLESISQFDLPQGYKPEKYIYNLIRNLPHDRTSGFEELIQCVRDITTVDNDHRYVDDIIERLEINRMVGLSKIIELASRSVEWERYIRPIKEWLSAREDLVKEASAVASGA